jgi:hypothetical protein
MIDTVAIVAATIIGPLSAVLITLWHQDRSQKYQRRLHIFRLLTQWRGNWLHPDWVGALNLIPVEFAGKTDVLHSFNLLIEKLTDPGFGAEGEELSQAYNRAEAVFIELMQKLARILRIDLAGLDLRTRLYAPRGWWREQQATQALRTDASALLNGERALRVTIVGAP